MEVCERDSYVTRRGLATVLFWHVVLQIGRLRIDDPGSSSYEPPPLPRRPADLPAQVDRARSLHRPPSQQQLSPAEQLELAKVTRDSNRYLSESNRYAFDTAKLQVADGSGGRGRSFLDDPLNVKNYTKYNKLYEHHETNINARSLADVCPMPVVPKAYNVALADSYESEDLFQTDLVAKLHALRPARDARVTSFTTTIFDTHSSYVAHTKPDISVSCDGYRPFTYTNILMPWELKKATGRTLDKDGLGQLLHRGCNILYHQPTRTRVLCVLISPTHMSILRITRSRTQGQMHKLDLYFGVLDLNFLVQLVLHDPMDPHVHAYQPPTAMISLEVQEKLGLTNVSVLCTGRNQRMVHGAAFRGESVCVKLGDKQEIAEEAAWYQQFAELPYILHPIPEASDADSGVLALRPLGSPLALESTGRNAQQCVNALNDIGRTLRAIHDKGAVHHDISAGNVIVASGHGFLIDFGCMRAVGDDLVLDERGVAHHNLDLTCTARYASRGLLEAILGDRPSYPFQPLDDWESFAYVCLDILSRSSALPTTEGGIRTGESLRTGTYTRGFLVHYVNARLGMIFGWDGYNRDYVVAHLHGSMSDERANSIMARVDELRTCVCDILQGRLPDPYDVLMHALRR